MMRAPCLISSLSPDDRPRTTTTGSPEHLAGVMVHWREAEVAAGSGGWGPAGRQAGATPSGTRPHLGGSPPGAAAADAASAPSHSGRARRSTREELQDIPGQVLMGSAQ